jgi:Na+-driven multidrug efflux pump
MIQSSINSFGGVLMSGNAAAGNIEGFVYVTMNAFHQKALNFIGQNVGAHQFQRVKKILWTSLGCVLVAGLAVSTTAWVLGEQLLSFYITDSPEAIGYGMLRLSCICIPYFICGLMDVSTGALRGMGASLAPMIISVLGVCGFRIAWIMTVFRIPAFHTPQSLYFSYPISWFVTFVCQMIAFFIIFKKYTKQDA